MSQPLKLTVEIIAEIKDELYETSRFLNNIIGGFSMAAALAVLSITPNWLAIISAIVSFIFIMSFAFSEIRKNAGHTTRHKLKSFKQQLINKQKRSPLSPEEATLLDEYQRFEALKTTFFPDKDAIPYYIGTCSLLAAFIYKLLFTLDYCAPHAVHVL